MSNIIDFNEETTNSVFSDKLDLEAAVSVVAWIEKNRKSGRKGFPYEVNGNPVLSKDDAVSLKATFVHNKWVAKDAKLSSLAYDNNADMYAFDAWSDLLDVAGMLDEIQEEDTSVDV